MTARNILLVFTPIKNYGNLLIQVTFHIIPESSGGALWVIPTYGPSIPSVSPSHVCNMFLICLTGGIWLMCSSWPTESCSNVFLESVGLRFKPNVFCLTLDDGRATYFAINLFECGERISRVEFSWINFNTLHLTCIFGSAEWNTAHLLHVFTWSIHCFKSCECVTAVFSVLNEKKNLIVFWFLFACEQSGHMAGLREAV